MTPSRKLLVSCCVLVSTTVGTSHLSAQERRTGIEHVIVIVEGANDEWTPTPVELSTGDVLISVARGSIKISRSSGPIGPDGQRDGTGALQMKIGTTNVRTIGSRAIVQEPSGPVKLRVVDTAFTDNEGRFQVELLKIPAAAIPPPRTVGEPRQRLDKGLAVDLLNVVDANPLDPGAPTALKNACVIFEKVSATDEASECRNRLERDYPNGKPSPELLTRAYVKREVGRSIASIKTCYDHTLRRNASAEGQVTLGWTILPDGSVQNVGVKLDSVRDPALINCMRMEVARWRFAPMSGGPIDVQFPFKFKAGAVN